ncbi:MAG: hypothetical protein M1150_00440 [Patescibacteria group bacterium]|nr:hypothetical protein [Patescibacteria group bacterium]
MPSINWLRPTDQAEPAGRVVDYLKGKFKEHYPVLEAYNQVDPLRCYFGEDCNPDEYQGYAERTITALEKAAVAANHGLNYKMVREAVRRAFSVAQIGEGFVSEESREQLAVLIAPHYHVATTAD